MAFNDPFVFQLGVAQPTPVFSSHSVAMIGTQELLHALQGQRKCLPEVFDAWNLYVDYFLGRGFGYVREAKFCSVRGLCTKLTGKRYMGFQNVFLEYFYYHVHYP